MDEPIKITRIDYDGNERRGLTAVCRRPNGAKYIVAAADVTFPINSAAARYLNAYRKWLGVETLRAKSSPHRKPRHKAEASDLNAADSLELVALSVKQRAARCLVLGTERLVTFRADRVWSIIPGEIITMKLRKQWSYGGHPYVSGNIVSTRVDAKALNLVPLRLEDVGPWNPAEHYWGEEGEPVEDWAKPIASRGIRPAFVMEQVIPGWDGNNDPFSDPISESNDLLDAGKHHDALKILMTCATPIFAALMRMLTLATSSSTDLSKMQSGFSKWVCVSVNFHLRKALTAYLNGVTSTTVPSCAACTAMAYACGV